MVPVSLNAETDLLSFKSGMAPRTWMVSMSVCSFAGKQIGDQSSKYLHLDGIFACGEKLPDLRFCFAFEEQLMPQRAL